MFVGEYEFGNNFDCSRYKIDVELSFTALSERVLKLREQMKTEFNDMKQYGRLKIL